MNHSDLSAINTFSLAFNRAMKLNHAVALWADSGCNTFNLLIDQSPCKDPEPIVWNSPTKGFLIHPFIKEETNAAFLLKPDLNFQSDRFSEADHISLSTYSEPSLAYEVLPSLNFSEKENEERDYISKVEYLLDEIKTGSIKKIVLSRHKDVEYNFKLAPVQYALELRKLYPNAFIAVVYHPTLGCWIGASPELLSSIDQEGFYKTISLAGTQAYDKHKSLKEHRWTNKEIEEQAIVTRYIVNCFKTIRLREYEEEGPKNYLAGNLVHLCTRFRVNTQKLHIDNLVDQMLPLLHPTSATCGQPKEKALSLIQQYEKVNRQLYTGYWGPLNIGDTSAVYVNLRCAQLYANGYRAYAGAGITADSIPAQEWTETEHKLQSIETIWSNISF